LILSAALAMLIFFLRHRETKPADALNITVIGHQFWWEYRYPQLGIVTANELHVPVSDTETSKATYLTLSSADTEHSFFVPGLDARDSVVPNHTGTLWLRPKTVGIYAGSGDAKMMVRAYVDTSANFAAWVKHQQEPAVNDPSVASGRKIFEHTACVSCHTVSGTIASGKFGPDLTHLAGRETIGAGIAPNTPANLRAFIENPAKLKPGTLMPAMHLSDHDLDAVTAYLMALR
jgi:cytochrome c oxidase subunit 2